MNAVDRRGHELDTIAAALPMERRDELAELLTDQNVETLKQSRHRSIQQASSDHNSATRRSGRAARLL